MVIHTGNTGLKMHGNRAVGTTHGAVNLSSGTLSDVMTLLEYTPSNPVDFRDSIKIGGQLIGKGTAIPTSGTYCDIFLNKTPTAGLYWMGLY